jgi:hypothetical protein
LFENHSEKNEEQKSNREVLTSSLYEEEAENAQVVNNLDVGKVGL